MPIGSGRYDSGEDEGGFWLRESEMGDISSGSGLIVDELAWSIPCACVVSLNHQDSMESAHSCLWPSIRAV